MPDDFGFFDGYKNVNLEEYLTKDLFDDFLLMCCITYQDFQEALKKILKNATRQFRDPATGKLSPVPAVYLDYTGKQQGEPPEEKDCFLLYELKIDGCYYRVIYINDTFVNTKSSNVRMFTE